MCFLFYSIINAFLKIGNDFLQTHFNLEYKKAGLLMANCYFAASFLNPVFGWLIDKYGKRILFMTLANLCLFTGLFLFIMLPILNLNGYYCLIPITLFGAGFAIVVCSIWPIFPLLVEKKYLGLALGVDSSALNLSYLINPLICGFIYD